MVAKTVLVVEDDPSLRIVAEEMFVAAGFEVESMERADHAVDLVAGPKKLPFCPDSRPD